VENNSKGFIVDVLKSARQTSSSTVITILLNFPAKKIIAAILLIRTLLSDFAGSPPFHYFCNSSIVKIFKQST